MTRWDGNSSGWTQGRLLGGVVVVVGAAVCRLWVCRTSIRGVCGGDPARLLLRLRLRLLVMAG